LPVSRGEGVAPKDTLDLSGLERDLDTAEAPFVLVGELTESLRKHDNHEMVRGMFPDSREACRRLGEFLSASPVYYVGSIPVGDGTLDVAALLEAFDAIGPEAMKVGGILRILASHGEPLRRLCEEELLPQLARPIPMIRLQLILSVLVEHIRSGSQAGISPQRLVYLAYLREAAGTEGFMKRVLPKLRLLNRRGQLKPASELCLDAYGVDAGWLLDEGMAEVLRAHVCSPRTAGKSRAAPEAGEDLLQLRGHALQQKIDATPDTLRGYFAPWLLETPPEVIGLFTALLGDEPGLKEYAEEMLGTRHVRSVRNSITWQASQEYADIHEVMAHQATAVTVVEQKFIEENSLTGKLLSVPLSDAAELTDLLVGDTRRSCRVHFSPGLKSGKRAAWLQLRRLAPGELEERQFPRLLGGTVRALFRSVFIQEAANVDVVLDELMESEQIEVGVARELLLENAFFYLTQRDTGHVLHRSGPTGEAHRLSSPGWLASRH
jgi:hypothetical protein